MSYDIHFKVPVAGTDQYIAVGEQYANTTWNLREMIRASTGLEWKNEENNGLVKDVITYIQKGLDALLEHPEQFKQYESSNGWGTVSGCITFFLQILMDWEDFCRGWPEFVDVATFWIE